MGYPILHAFGRIQRWLLTTRQHGQVSHTHLLPWHASDMRCTMDIAASTMNQSGSNIIAGMATLRVMIPVDEACGRTRGR